MKKLLMLLLALAMVLSLAACGTTTPPAAEPEAPAEIPAEDTPAEQPAESPAEEPAEESAAASFTVIVTDLDGTESTFEYTSEAETVGEALLAEGLIAGDQSDWGLMVTTVNGITADWEAEKAYWAFYIGEEYAQTGVDATDIVADTEYSFVKTISE